MKRAPYRVLVLFGSLAVGCAHTGADGEEWLKGDTDPFHSGRATDTFLQPADVRPVARREAAALERLKDRSWVELEPDEARRFGVNVGDGVERLFLLRAVRAGSDRSGFHLRWREGAVRVQHFARVSEAPIPLHKCAVVARLPKEPTALETGISIVE